MRRAKTRGEKDSANRQRQRRGKKTRGNESTDRARRDKADARSSLSHDIMMRTYASVTQAASPIVKKKKEMSL